MGQGKVTIGARLPSGIVAELKDIQKELDLDDFSDALKYCVKIGIFIHQRRKDLQDPPIVAFLRDNFRSELLVDWFNSLRDEDFEAIYAILADQRRIRYSTRKPHDYEPPPRRLIDP